MMKKIGLFCFFCLVVSGCLSHPRTPDHQVSNIHLDAQSSGELLQINDENSPNQLHITVENKESLPFLVNSGRIELFQINPQMSGFAHDLPLTNDYTRAIEELPLHSHKRDEATFRCFDQGENCDSQFLLGGEDEQWHYPYGWETYAIEKSQLPNYLPLQKMGVHSYLGELGYSSGYLVISPFKFPVDAQSIRFAQQASFQGFSNPYAHQTFTLDDQHRPLRFVNGAEQYTRYLADDDERVYFAPDHFSLARIRKHPDFQLLPHLGEKHIEAEEAEILQDGGAEGAYREVLLESFAGGIEVSYQNVRIYLSYDGVSKRFPIDGPTMKRQEYSLPEDSYFFNASLSDKNYHYQLVYYQDGDYYELKRIAK